MPDLTTLELVKNWQGTLAVTNTTADSLLSGLITATSADFLRAIKRVDLMTGQYVERRVGDGSPRLVLRHWPVSDVSSLSISGTAVVAQSAEAAGWYIDTAIDPERRYILYLFGTVFADGAPIAITYLAGYDAVPEDIQQAVTEWVVYRYVRKTSTGVKENRNIDGDRNSFEELAIPLNTQRVIDQYLREWPSLEGGARKPEPPPQRPRVAPAKP